jgi:hypothetical protein
MEFDLQRTVLADWFPDGDHMGYHAVLLTSTGEPVAFNLRRALGNDLPGYHISKWLRLVDADDQIPYRNQIAPGLSVHAGRNQSE